MEIFCFFMGILYGYTHHFLLPASTVLLFFLTLRYSMAIFFVCGLIIMGLHQWSIQPTGIPNEAVISKALLKGTVASIPVYDTNKTRFIFKLESLNNHPAQGLVQLAWYQNPPPLHAGQRWQLTAKLKKPRNYQNPGSYDYVSTLASRHIMWTGYIQSRDNQLIAQTPIRFNLATMRERLANSISDAAPNEPIAGIIEALTLNITRHVHQDHWELFRRTGTTHLFGISGEHIALISGLIFLLVKRVWSSSASLCLHLPAFYIASMCGLVVAFLYSLLAGFEPPVQRALVGCFFYTLYCLGNQKLSPWQVWRYALFTVLCFESHAVFMQGFYFSFLAVACILLTQQRWQLKGYKATLAIQLSCLTGLMPLTLYWYSYGSINGFIANLFAIPLVGLVIVPLSLITLLFCSYSWCWILMKPLSWLIGLLFQGLAVTERLSVVNITTTITSIEGVLACMGGLLLWILVPLKSIQRIALLWISVSFFPARLNIATGEALIRVLDVGQGLAVSIQTRNHVLLYDTGDQFYKGSDLGKMVILPFYTQMNVKKIDKLIISHPDKDHRGGLKSIEEQLPIDELIVNDRRYYHRGVRCHDYPQWEWDGVVFRFFPIKKRFKGKNNTSCILHVRNAHGSFLLTGDIEKQAEDYLVQTYKNALMSDVLLVPHHGSKTSSSYRFLLEVAPKYAIASLGFANRFHFPHTKTVNNISSLHIDFYRTDQCGMLKVLLPSKGRVEQPVCFKKN